MFKNELATHTNGANGGSGHKNHERKYVPKKHAVIEEEHYVAYRKKSHAV
jgi:hypothetical protein